MTANMASDRKGAGRTIARHTIPATRGTQTTRAMAIAIRAVAITRIRSLTGTATVRNIMLRHIVINRRGMAMTCGIPAGRQPGTRRTDRSATATAACTTAARVASVAVHRITAVRRAAIVPAATKAGRTITATGDLRKLTTGRVPTARLRPHVETAKKINRRAGTRKLARPTLPIRPGTFDVSGPFFVI